MLKVQRPRNLVDQLEKRQLSGYVIYNPVDTWWGRPLGAFAHCYVILRQPYQWVEVHHYFSYTNVHVYPLGYEWTKDVSGIIQPFTSEVPYDAKRVMHLFQPFTCVETCKSLLGIDRSWILTPKQLYRYLDNEQKT